VDPATTSAIDRTSREAPPGRPEGRYQAEKGARQQGEDEGESERRGVERDLLHPRQVAGLEELEGLQAAGCDDQRRRAADRAQDQALGQELPYELAAAGSESGPRGHLPLPGGGPRQQEVGHVGTSDE
jgi:hypothetical protein